MDLIRRMSLSVFAVLIFSVGLPAAHSQTRLAVPSYQNPGSTVWNSWAAQGPGALGIMIVDLDSGDDTSYHSHIDNAIQATRKQGIYVLGYTHTSYGTRDPKLIHQSIDALYANYLVDGIFFDEAPTNCSAANTYQATNFLYFQELTNYVRQKVGAHLTVMNPGTYSPTDCWMSITNILMNWENVSLSTYQSTYVDYPWVHQYPADRFWHIILGVPQAQLQTTLNLAQARNAGWVYISDSANNGYNQVPVYWTGEGTAIKAQGVQAPFATAWPNSSDSSGATVNARVSLRWRAINGVVWDILLDTDQNSQTGYHAPNLAVGADYLFEGSSPANAHLYRYAGSGTDWTWSEVPANAQINFPDAGINLVSFDQAGLGGSTALNYQIRSLDQNYNLLYTSYPIPVSLNNTGFVYDLLNHPQ